MGQPAVVTGKVGYGELGQDENLVFLYRLLFFSRKLQKRSLTCMTRGPSPNTLHTMVHV
jgi:hypothetical protein